LPTLNWIGKEAVASHHKEVPFRLVEPAPELSAGDVASGNLIMQGDNLLALKALLPRYAGQVKCIYIDPPYNTGNEGWVYNDNVNSPEIRRWLGEVVGKEGETLDRHDRWLCMMYPRLMLLKHFLREDGVIFISIDDNEVASLRLIMDEIFGNQNFIATLLWQKMFSPKNSARHFSEDHDYIVVYARNAESWMPNLLPRTAVTDSRYKNPDNDPRGVWTSSDLTARNYYSLGSYPVTSPTGQTVSSPTKGRYWTISKESFNALNRDNRIWWGENGTNMPRLKRFLSEVKDGVVPQTLWLHKDAGHTQEAKKELLEAVEFETSDDVFITPKPTRLIQRILQIATDKDSLVLDSFAGSGTTGHAVLKQNAEDGGNRRFILVEMDNTIAQTVTAERVKRVSQGYTSAKAKEVAGLGSGFQFCRLSDEPLFNADGPIRPDVTFAQLAEFVWFIETGTGLTAAAGGKPGTPLLGIFQGRAVFLLYNGILKDKTDTGGNVLNARSLAVLEQTLPECDTTRVVYAARNRFDKVKLSALNLTFHQLPYELAVKSWF
jgi:site-specific DNA-methyltransferase (adenine-specific)/adenine-specific DNA-methyltransferase